jgi:hypothetical protein
MHTYLVGPRCVKNTEMLTSSAADFDVKTQLDHREYFEVGYYLFSPIFTSV